jgi:hypothetical protein
MTRSRLFVLAATVIVALGVVAGLGALWLDPARASVGPLPAQALVLPADARFVMGIDVQRFTASPFYARYAKQNGMRPEALSDLEEQTGINPTRDVDAIYVAGSNAGKDAPTLAVVTGRFDLYKLGRAFETQGKARGYNHEGVTVYALRDTKQESGSAVAFLGDDALLFGAKAQVEAALSSRTRGEAPFRSYSQLLSLVEKVRPGATFWMVGDQSLLASMPTSVPGAQGGTMTLPQLRSLTVTGDLDPQVSLAVTGEAADETAAKNLADMTRGLVALMSLQAQQKPELQQLASAFTVATEANKVLVNARIPYALIDALQQAAPKPKPATAAAK